MKKSPYTQTIIFDKSCAEFYTSTKNDGSDWCYNTEFVRVSLEGFRLLVKTQGWLYYRQVYARFGSGTELGVSPILGWDAEQNPEFKYEIEEDKENNRIIIHTNPIKLK